MRTLIIGLSLASMVMPAQAAVFGIVPGQSLDGVNARPLAVEEQKFAITSLPTDDRRYIIVPPEPNPFFVSYQVLATPEAGICAVYAESAHQPDDYLAISLEEFAKVKRILDEKYGDSFSRMGMMLFRGDAPQVFGVHLTQYGAWWSGDLELIEAGLAHVSLVSSQGPVSVGVVYEFENFAECTVVPEVVIESDGL